MARIRTTLAVSALALFSLFSAAVADASQAALKPFAAPWILTYSDGSANGFRFEQAGTAPARYQYTPVKPEESSTGFYSGGKPASGNLDAKQVEALTRFVRDFEADQKSHVAERAKGTGAFKLSEAGGSREFIVEMGAQLQAFNEFLAPLRGSQPTFIKP